MVLLSWVRPKDGEISQHMSFTKHRQSIFIYRRTGMWPYN